MSERTVLVLIDKFGDWRNEELTPADEITVEGSWLIIVKRDIQPPFDVLSTRFLPARRVVLLTRSSL